MDEKRTLKYNRAVDSVVQKKGGTMANHESTWNLVEDKGTWVVRVRIWNPNTGKYTQKSKTTGLKVKDKTKNRAKKLAPEIASEVVKAFRREVGCDSARHMETFKDYVEEWVSFRKRSTWANTAMSYRGYAEKHIIPKLGGYKVQEIDWRILQRFCDNLLKTHKCASVRKYMIVVSGALKDAMKDGVIDTNPADLVELPKKEERFEAHALTKEEANMLLEASKDAKEPLRAAIMLGLCYGLRRSEVCGLRWIDIDFQQKTMRIRHTVTQNGDMILDEDHTKTKRSNRTLVLLDETIPYLKELLAKQKEAGLVMDKVVAWMNGKKVQPNSITRMFNTFLRKRGMGHIRFHDLRHTAATLLANNGTQLKVLQNFLGHNDVKVTLGVYTHDPENAGAQAASSMGQVFKKTFCSETCSERQLLAQER